MALGATLLLIGARVAFAGVHIGHAALQQAADVEQWGRWEQAWLGPSSPGGNPWLDVELTVEFTLEQPWLGVAASRTSTVRGFYDSDGLWRARFMPPDTGA